MGVGRHVPDAVGIDLDGNRRGWRSGRGDAVTVIALTSVTCPLCRKFGTTLARVEAAFAARGVRFVFVNVSGTDSVKDMRKQAGSLGLKGLSLRDADRSIADALGARTTTEVFVIDAANTLVYRGAASDQYGTNFTLEAARRRYLEDAIEAALAGQVPAVQATSSPGCALEPRPAAVKAASASAATVTYARDISRIIQANCVECHRQGGVGPFALDSYEAVSRRATMIRTVTEAGIMPPWFAAPVHAADGTAAPSPWANDRSLSESDKLAIAAWVDAGKPEGDRADLPLPRTFPGGEWTIGRPDAVFQIPAPIAVKADGFMAYQRVMVPTGLTEDRWVKAVQIVPTDPSVVHHVLVFALSERDAADAETRRRLGNDEAGGYWAAYVPGNDSMVFPEGMAKRLPARSTLLFQIHYTPNGTATTDQMKLGVVYAERAPEHVVRTASVASRRISIPPGAPNHREAGQVRVPADAVILAFTPHMHVRGKAYRYELEAADGSERKTILDVPEYDFNWQLRYLLREPLRAPKGSILHGTAWYDNSAGNPANPDPTKTVRWGPQTVDEMMLGYIEYYLAEEDPTQPDELPEGGAIRRGLGGGAAGPAGGRARGMAFERLRSQFDADGNGRIERAEVPESLHPQFDRLDRSKDGVLTADDFAR
ncbi:MAG: redoxin family protein [Phycisphaerales bacterium]